MSLPVVVVDWVDLGGLRLMEGGGRDAETQRRKRRKDAKMQRRKGAKA